MQLGVAVNHDPRHILEVLHFKYIITFIDLQNILKAKLIYLLFFLSCEKEPPECFMRVRTVSAI